MKRAAVIGLGDISATHINALRETDCVELCAVCDIDKEKSSLYGDEIPFYTDYHQMFQQEKPDCVHLCLPHYLHYPVSCDAAAAGIHVFCEKPMAVSKKEAIDFVRLEQEHPELYLGICLQNRKNASTVMLKNIIEEGSYGKVTGVQGFVPWKRTKEYYEAKPWRGRWDTAGSGVMLNQSVHTLDLMYYFGGEITQLRAMAGQLLDYSIEVEDTVAAGLTYENGANGLFFASNANYADHSVSIRVALEKGEFLIQDGSLFRLADHGRRELLTEDKKLAGSKFYYGASHGTLIREFYQALEEGRDDYIHIKDSLMSIVLIDAILNASRFGNTVKIEKEQVFTT